MNIGGGGTANGTGIIQWSFETNNWFKWRFESTQDGWYKVVSAVHAPGKCIDVEGFSTSQGTRCILWDYTGTTIQQVRIIPNIDGSF